MKGNLGVYPDLSKKECYLAHTKLMTIITTCNRMQFVSGLVTARKECVMNYYKAFLEECLEESKQPSFESAIVNAQSKKTNT